MTTQQVPQCLHHEVIDNKTHIGTCEKCGRQVQYPLDFRDKPKVIKEGRALTPQEASRELAMAASALGKQGVIKEGRLPDPPKSKKGGSLTWQRHRDLVARKGEIVAALSRMTPKQASIELGIAASTLSGLKRRWGLLVAQKETNNNQTGAAGLPGSGADSLSAPSPMEELWYLRGWRDCARMVFDILKGGSNA